ncbi:TPA: hypothetical protein ACOTG0_002723 [Clostridium perfringens]
MKRILVIGLCLISLSFVACGNDKKVNEKEVSNITQISEEDKNASNEMFLALASEIINESLDQREIVKSENKDAEIVTIELELANVIERENERLETLVGKIYDEELLSAAKDYIEGNNLEIKHLKESNENYEKALEYGAKANELISTAIVKMVDDYGLVINEEHREFYDKYKEKVADTNKEVEHKKIAQELLSDIEFEFALDENLSEIQGEDYFKYTIPIENTSDVSFKKIDISMKLVDKDGIVDEGNNIIWEFPKGTKQDFYFHAPKEYESISITVESVTAIK